MRRRPEIFGTIFVIARADETKVRL